MYKLLYVNDRLLINGLKMVHLKDEIKNKIVCMHNKINFLPLK